MATPASTARAFATFQLLALTAQAGCFVLLWLSGFGQNPFPELPLPMILMFGALFTGPMAAVARDLAGRTLAAFALGALVLGSVYHLLTGASATYLAAPAAALTLTALYRVLPRRPGEMLPAMTVYVVATVLANYTFDSFLPLGGLFLVNVGTFFFGITFTQRDRVHRFGRGAVYLMIASAAIANVIMALHLGTPLRYVLVGFIAIVLSETADTEVYARLRDRPWFARVASSNAVSAPLDTILFTTLAFAGEEFATLGWMTSVIVTDIVVKYASGLVAALRLRAGRPERVAAT